MLSRLTAILRSCRFVCTNEAELQRAIAQALESAGIVFQREYRLGDAGRVDFYIPAGRVGIEVKVKGSPSSVIRQLHGYAGHAEIDGLILASTKASHRGFPDAMQGKPVVVVGLWRNQL
jgi:hypothetical protein